MDMWMESPCMTHVTPTLVYRRISVEDDPDLGLSFQVYLKLTASSFQSNFVRVCRVEGPNVSCWVAI
jgi:hypothetical protein